MNTMAKRFGVVAGGIIIGFLLIYYGFELVSVPGIKESHDFIFVIVGVVLIVAAVGYALFARRSRKGAPEQ
jgi:membrane protein DedA with SNARE-associated domain